MADASRPPGVGIYVQLCWEFETHPNWRGRRIVSRVACTYNPIAVPLAPDHPGGCLAVTRERRRYFAVASPLSHCPWDSVTTVRQRRGLREVTIRMAITLTECGHGSWCIWTDPPQYFVASRVIGASRSPTILPAAPQMRRRCAIVPLIADKRYYDASPAHLPCGSGGAGAKHGLSAGKAVVCMDMPTTTCWGRLSDWRTLPFGKTALVTA